MKANMIHTNSIKTYICAVLMLIGSSVSAWGTTGPYLKYNGTMYHNGETVYVDLDNPGEGFGGATNFEIGNNALWTEDSYGNYGVLHAELGGSGKFEFLTNSFNKGTLNCDANLDPCEIWYMWNYANNTTATFQMGYFFNGDDSGNFSRNITISEKQQSDNTTDIVSATITITYRVTLACTSLAAPTGLSVTENVDEVHGKTRLGWNAVANATGYIVSVSNGVTTNTAETSNLYIRSTFPSGNYTWSVKAKGDGTTYCAEGAAADGAGWCVGAASAPTGLSVSSIATNSATVSWDALAGADSYYVTIKNNSTGVKVSGYDEKEVSETSLDVTGLSAGVTYKVELYALDVCTDITDAVNTTFTTLHDYTIDLNGNGGSDGMAGVYENGTSLHDFVETPTRAGYTLEGYYTTSACATKIADTEGNLVGSITVSSTPWTNSSREWVKGSDATFYANWTAIEYTITYNNMSGATNHVSNPATYTAESGAITLQAPTKTGYTFGGWFTDADLAVGHEAGTPAIAAGSTGNKVFYAKWTAKSTTIKLHDNNGDANSGTATVSYDATSLTSISHASKAGNTLLGYYDATSAGNKVLTSTGTFVNATGYVVDGKWANESANVTLYAYWSTNSHKVTFNMQSHGSAIAQQDVNYNDYVSEPSPAPTDVDYNFGGWYKEAGCVNKWVFNTDKMPDEDLTLYAKWTAKTYQKRIFACVDISVGLEEVDAVPQKVLITSRNGMNIIGVRKLLVTVDGALAGHTVSITSEGGLKFYKLADGKFVELTGAANVLRAPLDAAEVYVSYNPTSDGDGSITAPRFTIACDGESQEFNTGGEYVKVRNLPDAVAIVANVGGSWHGLSANITSSSTPKDQMVAVASVEGILKAYAPTNDFGYKLWQVRTVNSSYDRSGYTYTGGTPAKLYGDRLRFAGYGAKGLLANNNASSNQYNINNTGTINDITSYFTNDENYEWKVTTREVDGQFIYTFQTDQTNNTRYLRLWNGRWGTYQDGKGTEDLYLLPIVETALVDMQPFEWGADQVVVYYTPAATPVVLTGVNVGSDAAASPTFAQIGSSDLWRVSGLTGLTGKPAQQLQVMITENGAAKQGLLQIPLIVSGTSTEAELRASLTGANATEKNKVAKNTDVVILRNGKMTTTTASGNFKDLYIYAGGKAIITNAMSFGSMYMRGGFSYIGAETWDVPRAKIDAAVTLSGKLYYDLTMNATKYYDLAVPYEVDLNATTDDKGDGDFNVWLKVYDGAKRAGDSKKGWVWYNWSGDLKLHPGTGYLIEAEPRYNRTYCTVRFPMSPDLSSGESAVLPISVTAHGINSDGTIQTGKTANNVGWNFIANPFMCDFGTANMSESDDGVLQIGELAENGEHKYEWDTEGSIRYVTTFDYNTQEYSQHPLSSTVLAPFTGFFVQIAKAGSINFATAGRQLSAPAIIRAGNLPSDMEIAITASGNGQSDETRLHINDELTLADALEFPDEMTKQINAGKLNFYTISANTNMYANGMSYADAQEWIPAGVVVPADGTYTFSVGTVNENFIKSVLLLDKSTGIEYDLTSLSPQLTMTAGTFDARYAVKIVLRDENETPTGVDELEGESDQPFKFIYHDKMFILNNGVIYDATGKKVREIHK